MLDEVTIRDIGEWVIALGGWLFAYAMYRCSAKNESRRKQQEYECDQIDRILDLLDSYGELNALYGFLSRFTSRRDENLDENGRPVFHETVFEPEQEIAMAVESLEQTSINGAIAQKIVQISLQLGNARDALYRLDHSDNLNKALMSLNFKATGKIRFWMEKVGNVEAMAEACSEAEDARMELRSELLERRARVLT